MKKFIAIIIATFALEAGIIAVGSGAVHAGTGVQTSERLCVKDTVNGGQYCGNVWNSTPSRQRTEGRAILAELRDDMPGRCIHYLGWSSRVLADSGLYRAYGSDIKANRYHIYKVERADRCQVAKSV